MVAVAFGAAATACGGAARETDGLNGGSGAAGGSGGGGNGGRGGAGVAGSAGSVGFGGAAGGATDGGIHPVDPLSCETLTHEGSRRVPTAFEIGQPKLTMVGPRQAAVVYRETPNSALPRLGHNMFVPWADWSTSDLTDRFISEETEQFVVGEAPSDGVYSVFGRRQGGLWLSPTWGSGAYPASSIADSGGFPLFISQNGSGTLVGYRTETGNSNRLIVGRAQQPFDAEFRPTSTSSCASELLNADATPAGAGWLMASSTAENCSGGTDSLILLSRVDSSVGHVFTQRNPLPWAVEVGVDHLSLVPVQNGAWLFWTYGREGGLQAPIFGRPFDLNGQPLSEPIPFGGTDASGPFAVKAFGAGGPFALVRLRMNVTPPTAWVRVFDTTGKVLAQRELYEGYIEGGHEASFGLLVDPTSGRMLVAHGNGSSKMFVTRLACAGN